MTLEDRQEILRIVNMHHTACSMKQQIRQLQKSNSKSNKPYYIENQPFKA